MRRPFDRRVARSAPSERARGGQGWDTGEYVQMRDVVVTPATICEEHAHAVEDAAPRPSLPSRSRIRFTRFSLARETIH
jgi:hypothetical protein